MKEISRSGNALTYFGEVILNCKSGSSYQSYSFEFFGRISAKAPRARTLIIELDSTIVEEKTNIEKQYSKIASFDIWL
ncbi:MAG: hypothetical protein JRN52_13300 [Nitrososphaerota archaeon]|nr:hypothetical protein [Nitrososphaerota archaeon]